MAEAVDKAWLDAVFEKTKNWGRWGAEDERGALNLSTPAHRAAAAALAREGVAVSCARDLPVEPSAENPRPAQHHMLVAGDAANIWGGSGIGATMDFVGVACHGMATSHIDAFCHIAVDGRLFNGFPVTDVKSTGAQRGSIRPWIGVNSLEEDGRIKVMQVNEESPADRAGIVAGDIILAVNGESVDSLENFYGKLWGHNARPGNDVRLAVLHGVRLKEVTVRSIDRREFMRHKPGI
jgi:hypothetical protein